LLYSAGGETLLAEAIITEDMCPSDSGGSGTGSEGQTVEVTAAKYMPSCVEFEPDRVVNPNNHRGPAYSRVSMYKRICDEGEEWVIFDVEIRKFCAMAGIEDRESGLVAWGLQIGAEWCPDDEPDEACVVVEYDTCDEELPALDVSLLFDPLYACCGFPGSGSGSGT